MRGCKIDPPTRKGGVNVDPVKISAKSAKTASIILYAAGAFALLFLILLLLFVT